MWTRGTESGEWWTSFVNPRRMNSASSSVADLLPSQGIRFVFAQTRERFAWFAPGANSRVRDRRSPLRPPRERSERNSGGTRERESASPFNCPRETCGRRTRTRLYWSPLINNLCSITEKIEDNRHGASRHGAACKLIVAASGKRQFSSASPDSLTLVSALNRSGNPVS